jgi:hypothetical protein
LILLRLSFKIKEADKRVPSDNSVSISPKNITNPV